MRKTIYICGPVSGHEKEEVFARFAAAQSMLRKLGWEPVSPLDNGLDWDAPWESHMKEGLIMMLRCDAVYVMKGWEESRGCSIEVGIAKNLVMEILEEDNDL